jgi:hypothetical protein
MTYKYFYRLVLSVSILLLLGTMIYLGRRPRRTVLEIKNIQPGINYYRGFESDPYRAVYHLLEIDLTTPSLSFLGAEPGDGRKYAAQTVEEFARVNKAQIAINANFFYPFTADAPWDYYPRQGELVEVKGTLISDGVVHNWPEHRWPALCISDVPRAEIHASGRCPEGTKTAVAGNIQTLVDGEQIQFPDEELMPRTVIGVNETGDRMWILVIDGRQPFYSAGATLYFTSKLLKSVGASDVLNLDGGGSATMVIEENGEPKLFNSPIHTRIVMLQRPVANYLGIQISQE